MKKIYKLLSVSLLAFITACSPDIDNYTEPGEAISGKVIDSVTGQPIQTEQPNGFQISFKEIGYSADAPNRFFWGKADGTFQNTKMFENEYEITAVNGLLIQPETQMVNIKGNVQVDFTVTPYLNISEASLSVSGDELTMTYRLHRPTAVTAKINNAFVAIDWNPNVGNAVSKAKTDG